MNVAKLKVGDTYKNYKELCSALGIAPTSGYSKMKQLKEMETLFRYSKDKYSFKIEEIYEKPILRLQPTPVNKTSRYQFIKPIQIILMQYLIYENPVIKLQASQLYEKIGLLSPNYTSYKARTDFLKSNPDITKDEINVVRTMAFNKCYSVMSYTLKRMEQLEIIHWNKEYIILTKDGTSHTANTHEEVCIEKVRDDLFEEWEVKSMSDLYLRGLSLSFFKQLNSILQEEHDNWINISQVVSITYLNKVTMRKLDVADMKQQINDNLVSYLQKTIEKKHHQINIDPKLIQPSQALNKLTLNECKRKTNLIINEFVKNVVQNFD